MRFANGLCGSLIGALAATTVCSLLIGPVAAGTWAVAVGLACASACITLGFEDLRWADNDYVAAGIFNMFVGMMALVAVGNVTNAVDMSFNQVFDAGVFALWLGMCTGIGFYAFAGRVRARALKSL